MKNDKQNIIWLVSYPKSGNTWLRIIFENLLSKSEKPISINSLNRSRNASSRFIFDEFAGANASDLSKQEIDEIRPIVYKNLSRSLAQDAIFLKVHECWYRNILGEEIYPKVISKGVVYIVRNPLDVAVSFSFHFGLSYDKVIDLMNNNEFSLAAYYSKLHYQLHQKISSWSTHIQSWVDNSHHNLHIIRYEDLHSQPLLVMRGVLNFLGLDFKEDSIERAIKFSSFYQLQQQEKLYNFNEKPIKSKSFFRNGKSGYYHDYLSPEQIEKISLDHKSKMTQFGYSS